MKKSFVQFTNALAVAILLGVIATGAASYAAFLWHCAAFGWRVAGEALSKLF